MHVRLWAAGFTAVAMLAGTQVAAAGASSSAPTPTVGRDAASAERLLRAASDGKVSIRRDSAGQTHYVGTAAGQPVKPPSTLTRGASPAVAARAHLTAYGAIFGISDQARQLRQTRATALGKGESAVRFQQLSGGIPVLGGELVVEVDNTGALVSINGETSRQPVPAAGAVSAARALSIAVAATAKGHKAAASSLTASAAQAWVYDPSLVGAPGPQGARQVWRTEVTGAKGAPLRQLVLVDAATGVVVLSVDEVNTAKNRTVCDMGNVELVSNTCPQPNHLVLRSEGGPPAVDAQVNSAYDLAGETYDFYNNRFGRDSINNAGLPLISAVKFCPEDGAVGASQCPYANAFWDGTQMTYGDGYADADDVVAHELTHGVTENESGLLYWYESGAINESMSDVFGEFADLSNSSDGSEDTDDRWLLGEDLPIGAIRNMSDPNEFDQPATTSDPMWNSDWFDAGGVHTNSGVGNKAAELITDGGTLGTTTVTGIGLDKAARIYYDAEQTLTSGSDYRDLYNILRGSCTALVGTTPNNAAGTASTDGAITADDCLQVAAALTAVKMNVYPAHDAKIPTAPSYCSTGYTVTNLLLDNFETATNWTGSGAWTRNKEYQATATSGFAAYVPDFLDTADPTDPNAVPNPSDNRLTTSHSYALPSGRSSYLRFDHADAFDWYGPPASPLRYWDGGFVEVSVDGAAYKPLSVAANGYNHTIEATGTPGFGGDSTDWYTSRATMTSFAGKNVKFRFRMLTDGFESLSQSYGWWLDNVRLYSCKGPGAPASVTVKNKKGKKAKMKWSAATANSGFSIASYVVKRKGKPAVTVSASTRSKVFKHLKIGKTYTFKIYAKNNAGVHSVTVKKKLKIT